MNWNDPVDRVIETHALAWQEASGRMVRAAMRAVDDILFPSRALQRKALRARLLREAEWQATVMKIAKEIQARRGEG